MSQWRHACDKEYANPYMLSQGIQSRDVIYGFALNLTGTVTLAPESTESL